MKAVDRFDITEAFEALDHDCSGVLPISPMVHELFLGLGYQPESLTVEELHHVAGTRMLTLEKVIELFGRVRKSLVSSSVSYPLFEATAMLTENNRAPAVSSLHNNRNFQS